jgi:hypothetical protein
MFLGIAALRGWMTSIMLIRHSSVARSRTVISIGLCSMLRYFPNASSKTALSEEFHSWAAALSTVPLLAALSPKAIWEVLANSKEPSGMDALSQVALV